MTRRSRHGSLAVALLLPCLSAILAPAPASAQHCAGVRCDAQPGAGFAVFTGPATFDLSGVGSAAFASFRGWGALGRVLALEGAVGYLAYTDQGLAETHHLMPEVQLQARWPGARLQPYVGAGVGASFAFDADRSFTDLTASAAAGLRYWLVPGWAVGGELRVRAIDPWAGSIGEFGLGITSGVGRGG